jgi:hypothetical protein
MGFGTILSLIGAAAASFFGAKFIGGVDDGIEDRKRGTMKLALWAQQNGLGVLSGLLENYTVGAKSELVRSIREIVDVVRDEEKSKVALDQFLSVQLRKQLSTSEGKKRIFTEIGEILNVVIDPEAFVKAPAAIGEVSAVEGENA